jgi:hypothetical protein
MKRAVLFLLLLSMTAVAQAAPPPDLAPVTCAWTALPPELQKRLRDSVTIDNRTPPYTLYTHDLPTDHEVARAAQACNLNYATHRLIHLAGALGYRAREEVARSGLAARGVIRANVVDRAVGLMDEDRRIEIGDTLSCGAMNYEWDRSVISAIRRAGTKAVDGASVAYVGMAMYAIMAQEGFMRRVAGGPLCPPK